VRQHQKDLQTNTIEHIHTQPTNSLAHTLVGVFYFARSNLHFLQLASRRCAVVVVVVVYLLNKPGACVWNK
jgi:hypothetical protein